MPTSAAENVTAGLMWPPETGLVARRRIAMVIEMSIAIIRFGVFVLVSYEEITIVSIANTNIAVPISSANDAFQTWQTSTPINK